MINLDAFAEQLATLSLHQVEQAVAVIWFHDHGQQGAAVSTRDVAESLHRVGLCSEVNRARLHRQLGRHPDVVRDSREGYFRLKAASRSKLDDKYADLLGKRRVRVSDSILPREQFASRRRPWQELVAEINGCYDHRFFDGAAVLCRRLAEILTVEAFKAVGAEAAIKTPKDEYMMMDGLIGVLGSGRPIRLTKSARPTLEPIKNAGDIAAHSPHHITNQTDVDAIANHMRLLVSELLGIIDANKKS